MIDELAYYILRAKDEKRKLAEALTRHRYMDSKSDYSTAIAPRSDKYGGYIAIDGKVVAETKSCGHCGAHWTYRPGSGILRGFCRGCMRDTCGDLSCAADGKNGCVTWERKMEMIEAREKRLIAEGRIVLS